MKTVLKYAAALMSAAFICLGAKADRGVKLAWDAAADISFDNREYSACGDWVPSMTLFGVRAEAAIGVGIMKGGTRHRILGGISPLYHFGGGWRWQPLLYYRLDTRLRNSNFRINAGAFSRHESKAFYSMAFYSDRDRFLDNTYEGIQFSWDAEKFYFELGVDWKGMIRSESPATREEFQVYSGGHYDLFPWMRLAYSAYLHHFACSFENDNVVDDARFNPYIDFEFGKMTGMQSLMLRTGFLGGYQNDRRLENGLSTPFNGNFLFRARHWNVILEDELYVGNDPLPLYNNFGPDGVMYGTNLYMSDPILRSRNGQKVGYFNRLGIAWAPRIVKGLDFMLRVNFDFNGGFLGSQQIIQVKYRF